MQCKFQKLVITSFGCFEVCCGIVMVSVVFFFVKLYCKIVARHRCGKQNEQGIFSPL